MPIVVFEFAINGLWPDVWNEIHEHSGDVGQNTLVHAQDPSTGKTLLHYAVEQAEEDAVEELLAVWRVNVHVRDYNSRKPIDLARRVKEKTPHLASQMDELITLLEEAGRRQVAY